MLIYCCLGNLLCLVIIFSANYTGWYRSVTPQVMLRLDHLIFEGGWWVILKQNILPAYQEPMVDFWAYLHSKFHAHDHRENVLRTFSQAQKRVERRKNIMHTNVPRNKFVSQAKRCKYFMSIPNHPLPLKSQMIPPPPPEPNSSRKMGRSNYFQLYFLQTQANLYWTYLVLLFEVATISFHGILRFNK